MEAECQELKAENDLASQEVEALWAEKQAREAQIQQLEVIVFGILIILVIIIIILIKVMISDGQNAKRLGLKMFCSRLDTTGAFKRLGI